MKKNLFCFFIIALLLNLTLFPEIPEGYYDSAKDLKGIELKRALYNIIKGHVKFKYTANITDVWDILKEADRDPNNPDNVILLYTGWSVNAAQEYNNGKGWGREHVWSQSHGEFGRDEKRGAGTDVHHLRPVDNKANSKKSNRFFDNGGEEYVLNNLATCCYYNNDNWTWEPRDLVKGDVARMIFYMAVRYEGENNEPDLEITNEYVSKSDKRPLYGKLVTLLIWHGQDPVDDWEKNRNDIIYEKYQKNRNPFIDHPEYAWLIWGDEIKNEN